MEINKHSEHFPDCFYRVTVKGICVRDGKVLLEKEGIKTLSGCWEIPGGGLDFGENMREGLKREIQEEMGLEITKISKAPVYIWTHRHDNNHRKIGWYYSLVIVYRIEFKDLNFRPSEECEAIDFFSKEQLMKMEEKELNGQTKEFAKIFNPEDFKQNF